MAIMGLRVAVLGCWTSMGLAMTQSSNKVKYIIICVSAQRKGPSVGIFISKRIRFYEAVQNFLKKIFFVNLLTNIVYCVYIDLYIHIFRPN